MTPAANPRRAWRAGDVLVVAGGAALCAMSFATWWSTGPAARAEIRQGGHLVAAFRLAEHAPARQVVVHGPLGDTRIDITGLRARVASDPGPRQICVRQGWLERAGAMALCAPNQVTLRLVAADGDVDSIHY